MKTFTSYSWNKDASDGMSKAERNLLLETQAECLARIRRFASGRITTKDVKRMLFVMDTAPNRYKEGK